MTLNVNNIYFIVYIVTVNLFIINLIYRFNVFTEEADIAVGSALQMAVLS